MQTQALNPILEHLQGLFAFDKNETKRLLSMLHKTITLTIPVLQGGDSEAIYKKAHKLHSELHICGYRTLSDTAAIIEIQARKGIIERELIKDFIAGAESFKLEIETWMGGAPDIAQ